MEKFILNLLNNLKENWIVISSFVVLCTTLFCIYISSSIFQLWDVSYLKYIDISEVYSFTLDSIGLQRSLDMFLIIIIAILQCVVWALMVSSEVNLNVYENKLSSLIFTNTKVSKKELHRKSDSINGTDYFFKSILKPINIFVLILAIASIYSCIIKINKYVDDYEINTDKYKHLLKVTLTLKDKKESVCAYVIYSNSDKIIFVECTTKKLTKLNQRYVISSSSEA